MTEGDPSAVRAARLKAIDWGRTMKKLVAKALRWGLSPMAAEDLANDAFVHFFRNANAKWNPEADPTSYRAILYIMDWKYDAILTLQANREEKMPTEVNSEVVEETAPISDRNVDGQVIEAEWVARKMAKLRAGLTGSALTLAMLDLYEEVGLLDPAQVAERLGVDVKAVYTAEAQLQRHIKRIEREGSDPDIVAAPGERATS